MVDDDAAGEANRLRALEVPLLGSSSVGHQLPSSSWSPSTGEDFSKLFSLSILLSLNSFYVMLLQLHTLRQAAQDHVRFEIYISLLIAET